MPYPLSNNTLNSPAIEKLSKQQRLKLKSDEPSLILEKIKEINPNFNIILFPKSLLQVYLYASTQGVIFSARHKFFANTINKIRSKHTKENKDMQVIGTSGLANFIFEHDSAAGTSMNMKNPWLQTKQSKWKPLINNIDDDTQKDWTYFSSILYKKCVNANLMPGIQSIWVALNDALVKEFTSAPERSNKDRFISFAKKWTDKLNNQYNYFRKEDDFREYDGYTVYDQSEILLYKPENINLLRNILNFEIECMFDPKIKHLYIIYRGCLTGPNGDLDLLMNEPNHSLSFSNGIFEGNINDKQACAINYMLLDNPYMNSGYAVLFDPELHRNMINTPPLVASARSLASGNRFHPRTNATQNKFRINKFLMENSVFVSDRREPRLKYDPFIEPTSLTSYMRNKPISKPLTFSAQANAVQNIHQDAFIQNILASLALFYVIILSLHRWRIMPASTTYQRPNYTLRSPQIRPV